MAEIRLNKIIKQFNIGLDTLVDFLNSQGAGIENANPNLKISEEYLPAIAARFGKDKSLREAAEIASAKINEAFSASDYTPDRVPGVTAAAQTSPYGHPSSTTSTSPAKVVGKIDLTQFDPKRTKKRERIQGQHRESTPTLSVNDVGSSLTPNQMLKEVWKEHLKLQQRQLDMKKRPIKVDASSARLSGNNLQISLDLRTSYDNFVEFVSNEYQDQGITLNGHNGFTVMTMNSSSDDSLSLNGSTLVRAGSSNIHLSSNPAIWGTISTDNSEIERILREANEESSYDTSGRLQISLEALNKLHERLALKNQNVVFPDTVSIILGCTPSLLYHFRELFPGIKLGHHVARRKKNNQENEEYYLENRIVFYGYTLQGSQADELKEKFGLRLRDVSLYCYLNPQNVDVSQIPSKYHYNSKNHSIVIRLFPYTQDGKESLETKKDLDFYATCNAYDLKQLFGKENVKFEIRAEYSYRTSLLASFHSEESYDYVQFLNEACQFFDGRAACNYGQHRLGVDFEWRGKSLFDVIEELSAKCPIASFSYFDNHRVNIDLPPLEGGDSIDFEQIKSLLQEDFPSIQFYDIPGGQLLFIQEYQDEIQASLLHRDISSELESFRRCGYNIDLHDRIPGKNQYVFFQDKESEEEDKTESVLQLKGFDFTAGSTPIGKLYKVQMPHLFIDCSEVDKDAVQALVDEQSVSSIIPDLAGEEEVLFRLNRVMEKLSEGKDLVNPRLGEVLFSIEKAMPITNLNALHDDYFQAINQHLINRRINKSQIDAIIKSLLAEDLCIIQGPPGTGKSTAIAEMIWQHININGAQKVLVTSETNIAVDNALSKVLNGDNNIVKPIRIGDTDVMESEGSQFALSTMRHWVNKDSVILVKENSDEDDSDSISSDVVLQNWLDNISKRSRKRNELPSDLQSKWHAFLSSPNQDLREIVYHSYVSNCNVIGATCSSIGENNRKGKPTAFFRQYLEAFPKDNHISFDVVIQDESSKATPAELALPLIYGKKNILIGDHRQLPPMIDRDEFISSMDALEHETQNVSRKESIKTMRQFIEAHFDEMEKSHFERLFLGADRSIKGSFNTQYRMHPDINDVIKQFYIQDGGLECGLMVPDVNDPNMENPVSRYHGISIDGLLDPSTHVLWIDTRTPEIKVGTSRVNYGEIEAIGHVLERLSQSQSFAEYLSKIGSSLDQQIGLISFYGKQVRLLRELKRKYQEIPTRVCTVDRFQGMERNIIIVSLVRSNIIAQTKEQKPDTQSFGPAGYPVQTSLGFAQSPNRLNVALSRAKRLLIIVGNSTHFRQKQIYANLFQTIQDNPHCKIVGHDELE